MHLFAVTRIIRLALNLVHSE